MAISRYFPFLHGVYDVKVGIHPLGKDFGNGEVDRQVFQLDEQYDAYRAAKDAAVRERDRHILRDRFDAKVSTTVEDWVITRLHEEHPGRFTGGSFNAGLDGLARLMQEDMAVLAIDEQGADRLVYLNVAMPSGWAPEEKIGKPFDEVHAPVPQIESLNRKRDAIARMMVGAANGAVRFAWTITDDAALNHHPHRDRSLAHPTPLPEHPAGEPLLRVERQVIQGFPQVNAALFLIRTYLYPFDMLTPTVRKALASAVAGMSDKSLRYKNMNLELTLGRLDSLGIQGDNL